MFLMTYPSAYERLHESPSSCSGGWKDVGFAQGEQSSHNGRGKFQIAACDGCNRAAIQGLDPEVAVA